MTPELEQKYLAIPFSFIAMLVGLIDGDGMFVINRTHLGYIQIGIKLELGSQDHSLLV